jgi:hypothetical protein
MDVGFCPDSLTFHRIVAGFPTFQTVLGIGSVMK